MDKNMPNTSPTSTRIDSDHREIGWDEQAREAARRYRIPLPNETEDTASAEQAELRLRNFEQEGGQ